ncbi:hypothetical protein [Paraclostridium bifermentans]|uniref:hypothetical protein n=1 Tax=Paraclostridium bifermentans TaxID=1490 RepID=UPI00359C29E1
MEELIYASEEFKKKNGYTRKKPLTAAERKENYKQRNSNLIDRINKLSTNEEKKISVVKNTETVISEKPTVEQLKALVKSIQNNK